MAHEDRGAAGAARQDGSPRSARAGRPACLRTCSRRGASLLHLAQAVRPGLPREPRRDGGPVKAETRRMKLLYREARGVSRPTPPFNAGLWYDKFVDLEYKPGEAPKLEKQPWIKSMVDAAREAWDAAVLAEAIQRQATMADALGGLVLRLRNTSRFVTGLGRAHPVENGFAWHHTLGTPYLPGSGLKGVLLAWMRMSGGSGRQDWFGEMGRAGDIVFLDLLPVQPPALCVEIMTPHYAPYYQNPDDPPAPGD